MNGQAARSTGRPVGWGRQSMTLAAMMALDVMPRADYLVHVDTRGPQPKNTPRP